MGLDSAQIDSIHAVVRTAVANGASPDSVHHALLAVSQLVDHLAQPLNLDSAQKAAIAQILARHQGAVDSAWRALQPKVGATLDDSYAGTGSASAGSATDHSFVHLRHLRYDPRVLLDFDSAPT